MLIYDMLLEVVEVRRNNRLHVSLQPHWRSILPALSGDLISSRGAISCFPILNMGAVTQIVLLSKLWWQGSLMSRVIPPRNAPPIVRYCAHAAELRERNMNVHDVAH
jgi:hypothetical protein